ncbi:MAG: DOPA 4,5-dioxygenase family protein [Myxococcota bacterium]
MNITGYHAHVYFDGPEQREQALALRRAVETLIPDARLGRVHSDPVAFHPQPMFQISFAAERFADLVPWLMLNHGALSILIHPLTGDALQEHTDQALWLGEQLPLDLDRLRRIAA